MISKKKETVISRYSNIAHVIDALSSKELALLDPKSWVDKNDSLYMGFYRQHRNVAAVFAACCTLSRETYHHWYVFGGQAAGAIIEYDGPRLKEHLETLKDNGLPIRFGKVKYRTLDQIENEKASPSWFPFRKRYGFQAEKEFRIVAECDDENLTKYSIPLPINLVRRVVINPWLAKPTVDSLRACIRSIAGCESLSVSHSRLIDSDRWEVAGTKMLAGYRRRHDPAYKKLRSKIKVGSSAHRDNA